MNEVIEQPTTTQELATIPDPTTQLLFNPEAMQQVHNLATIMAEAKITVPKHFQGSIGDCMAVIMQATQWGMNPFAVAQKTHLVSGNLGYEAQLVNAVVSSSKAIKGRFHYRFSGDWNQNGNGNDEWIQVGAIIAGEQEITWGERLYPAKVSVKNSPLWKTAPKQQAAYLAVKYWARLYCPDVILGVYSADEFEDLPERDITPPKEEVEPEESQLPPCSDGYINGNMNKWIDWVESGRTTTEAIIQKIQVKASLSEDQLERIRSLDQPSQEEDAA